VKRHGHAQRGAIVVETALVSLVLFTMLFGVIEMGRLLWTWNAAVEATRLGARLAATCEVQATSPSTADNVIKTQMRTRLSALKPENIVISYLAPPAAANTCTAGTCQAVRVALVNVEHQTLIPLLAPRVRMPAFSTTLRRERMSSAGNAACQ
jgi:Flp pilus assembly protein TadG